MLSNRLRGLLLAGSGLALVAATPALAQQQSQECTAQLDQIEQKMAQADLSEQRQNDVKQIVQGARTLADTGDNAGCMKVVAELEDLMQTLEQGGGSQSAQSGQQQGEQQAQSAQQQGQQQPSQEVQQALQQVDQQLQQAEQALGQDNVEEARSAMDQASQQLDQAMQQAQGQTQQQLQQVQSQLDQAMQALEQDDTEGARQALQQSNQQVQQVAQAGSQSQANQQGEAAAEAEMTAQLTIDQPQPQVTVEPKAAQGDGAHPEADHHRALGAA